MARDQTFNFEKMPWSWEERYLAYFLLSKEDGQTISLMKTIKVIELQKKEKCDSLLRL